MLKQVSKWHDVIASAKAHLFLSLSLSLSLSIPGFLPTAKAALEILSELQAKKKLPKPMLNYPFLDSIR